MSIAIDFALELDAEDAKPDPPTNHGEDLARVDTVDSRSSFRCMQYEVDVETLLRGEKVNLRAGYCAVCGAARGTEFWALQHPPV